MEQVNHWISELNLIKHPEGGYYSEVYRSDWVMDSKHLSESFKGNRNLMTSIYFLLQKPAYSAFHRIKSDELWFHHDGDALLIHVIHPNGEYEQKKLGSNISNGESLQHLVSAGDWFATEVLAGGQFGLVSCVVAPGFDFQDFEMADSSILKAFPKHKRIIERLLV